MEGRAPLMLVPKGHRKMWGAKVRLTIHMSKVTDIHKCLQDYILCTLQRQNAPFISITESDRKQQNYC